MSIELSFDPDGPTATSLSPPVPTMTRGGRVRLNLFFASDRIADYEAMAERLEWLSVISTGVSNNGVPWVYEDLPARAPFSTQIFRLEPGAELPFSSKWVVLTGGSDQTGQQNYGAVEAEVRVLAEGSRYADRAALRSDIGESGL